MTDTTTAKRRTETYIIVRSDGLYWAGVRKYWISDWKKANAYKSPETCSKAISNLYLPRGYSAQYISPDEID